MTYALQTSIPATWLIIIKLPQITMDAPVETRSVHQALLHATLSRPWQGARLCAMQVKESVDNIKALTSSSANSSCTSLEYQPTPSKCLLSTSCTASITSTTDTTYQLYEKFSRRESCQALCAADPSCISFEWQTTDTNKCLFTLPLARAGSQRLGSKGLCSQGSGSQGLGSQGSGSQGPGSGQV